MEDKKELCKKYDVEFLELPGHLSGGLKNPSIILAEKLNYVFDNIIRVREPKYFALIDQDFFPFKKFIYYSILIFVLIIILFKSSFTVS